MADAVIIAVRIEWAKAHVCKLQWEEEVFCLREEMRQTLRSLNKAESDWNNHSERGHSYLTMEEYSGRRTYALQQASFYRTIKASFEEIWGISTPSAMDLLDYSVAFIPDHPEPKIGDEDTSDDEATAIPGDSDGSDAEDHGA